MKYSSKIEYIEVDETDQEQIDRLNEEMAKGKVLKSSTTISQYMHFAKTDDDSHLQHKYILPLNFDEFKEQLRVILKEYSNDATVNTETDIENFLRNRLLNYFRTQQADLYKLLMRGKQMYDEIEEIRQLYIILSYNVLINKNYNKVISMQDLENMNIDDLTYSLIDMIYDIVDDDNKHIYRLNKEYELDYTVNIEETRKALLKKIEENEANKKQSIIKDSIVYNPRGIITEYNMSDSFAFEKWKMNNLDKYCNLINNIILSYCNVRLAHSFSFVGNNGLRWLEYDKDLNKKEFLDYSIPCEIVAKRIEKFIKNTIGYCPIVWGYDNIEEYWKYIFFNTNVQINIYNLEVNNSFSNFIYVNQPELYNLFLNDTDFLEQKIKNDIQLTGYYTIVQQNTVASDYKFEHPNACLLYASQYNSIFKNNPKITYSSLPNNNLSNQFNTISFTNYVLDIIVGPNNYLGYSYSYVEIFKDISQNTLQMTTDSAHKLSYGDFYHLKYSKTINEYEEENIYSYIVNIPFSSSIINGMVVDGSFENIKNKDNKTVYISKDIKTTYISKDINEPIRFKVDTVLYNYRLGKMDLTNIGSIVDIRLIETEWDYWRHEYLSNVKETEPYDYNYDVLKKEKSLVSKYQFNDNYIDIYINNENIKDQNYIEDPKKYIEDFHGYITVITKIHKPISLRSIKLTEYQYIAYEYEFDNRIYKFVSQKEMDKFADNIKGSYDDIAYKRYKNALKNVYVITRIPNIKIIAA